MVPLPARWVRMWGLFEASLRAAKESLAVQWLCFLLAHCELDCYREGVPSEAIYMGLLLALAAGKDPRSILDRLTLSHTGIPEGMTAHLLALDRSRRAPESALALLEGVPDHPGAFTALPYNCARLLEACGRASAAMEAYDTVLRRSWMCLSARDRREALRQDPATPEATPKLEAVLYPVVQTFFRESPENVLQTIWNADRRSLSLPASAKHQLLARVDRLTSARPLKHDHVLPALRALLAPEGPPQEVPPDAWDEGPERV